MPPFRDLTGQRFTRLTAVGITPFKSKKGGYIWHCTCTCGKTCKVTSELLLRGDVKSCGCLRREYLDSKKSRLHDYPHRE